MAGGNINIRFSTGLKDELGTLVKEFNKLTQPFKEKIRQEAKTYDFFICHAGQDKESFVRHLANGLNEKGVQVYFDEFQVDDLGKSVIEHFLVQLSWALKKKP